MAGRGSFKVQQRTFGRDVDYNVQATLNELVLAVTQLGGQRIPPDFTKDLRLLVRQVGSVQSLLESLRINFKRLDEQVNPPAIPHANAGGGGLDPPIGPPPPPGPGGGGGGGGGGGSGGCATPDLPLPNYYGTVAAVFAANPGLVASSCQNAGGNWGLMDAIVDSLRASDSRFGYNCKRGNCGDPSQDAIAYYWGPGGPSEGAIQVHVADVISGHCGPNPQPSWNDVSSNWCAGNAGWTSRGRF